MNNIGFSLLAMMLVSLIFVPIGQAQVSSVSCSDNTTLSIAVNDTRCIDDVCKEFSRSTSEVCAYGCDSTLNICNPSPLNTNLLVIGIIIVFVIVIAGVWRFVS